MQKAPTYRFQHDILAHKPSVTTIMLGMNDVDRGAYKPQGRLDNLKAAALADYDKNMCQLSQTPGRHIVFLIVMLELDF